MPVRPLYFDSRWKIFWRQRDRWVYKLHIVASLLSSRCSFKSSLFQPLDALRWIKVYPIECEDKQDWAASIHGLPATFTISSVCWVLVQPTLRSPIWTRTWEPLFPNGKRLVCPLLRRELAYFWALQESTVAILKVYSLFLITIKWCRIIDDYNVIKLAIVLATELPVVMMGNW